MINKEKLKRRFSRNAKQYDQYAYVQKIMGDHLVKHIQNKHSINSILEVGCGTGYVTRKLVELFPSAHITALDIAPGMIEHSRNNMTQNITFICDDIEEVELERSYDLIISNATFQWFNHFESTFEKLTSALTPRGQICFSTFGQHTFNELRTSFEAINDQRELEEPLKPSQQFFKSSELLEQCESILCNYASTFNTEVNESLIPEYFPTCQDFLMAVKKIGANNAQQNRSRVIPGFIDDVMAHYDQTHIFSEGVKATYHALYFLITKESSIV